MPGPLPEPLAEGRTDSFGGHPVTRDELLAFARQYDPQPFQLDDAAAAAHPFFREIPASGLHTAALTQRMIVERWIELGLDCLAFVGVEDLEWARPVYAGDVLRVETKVLETRPTRSMSGAWLVRTLNRVLNSAGEEVMRHTATALFSAAKG